MVPLLFSGMVEIIGFAISTILGALLGLLISRPAYAAIIEGVGD
jgi:preprotein translocase subunit SecD